MDASALEQYRFMRRIGIFGIETDSLRGAAAFLKVSSGLLEDPKTMLWITAEGTFTDARTRPVRLRPGLAKVRHAVGRRASPAMPNPTPPLRRSEPAGSI